MADPTLTGGAARVEAANAQAASGVQGGAINDKGILTQDGTTPLSASPRSVDIPAITPVTTINSTNTTPATPAVTPAVTTPTSTIAGAGVTGTAAALDASTKALIDAQNAKIKATTTDVTTDKSKLDGYISKLEGKGAVQSDMEKAAGIDTLTKNLTDVTNEYNTKQTAFKHQEEAILNTPGMTREQANAQVAETSRLHNQELADIAIRQSVASNNLTAATNLINHKIDLQYGDLKDLIAYQTNILTSDKSTLSTAETNKLTIQRDENQRLYTQLTTQTKALEDQKLETLKAMQANGATQAQMAEVQAQTTPQAVITTAGKYGVSLADQLIQANIKKALNDINASSAGGYKLGSNPAVDSWVANINSGKAKLSDVPATLKSSVSQGLAATTAAIPDILATTKSSVKELQDMVDNNKGFKAAVGVPDIFTHPLNFALALTTGKQGSQVAGTEAANFVAKFNQVKNDVILPNLTLLHGLGRVTDREFQALSSAITSLSTSQSEEDFKTELTNITTQIDTKIAQITKSPVSIDASPAKGTDGASYGFPGYVSDGKQWVLK